VQKRLNRSRCRLGFGLGWVQGSMRYVQGAHQRHLANTTEPSMCGGDAACCQITLATCFDSLCMTRCFLFYSTVLCKTRTVWSKKDAAVLLAVTSNADLGLFSELFYVKTRQLICNRFVTRDPITPETCRYTTV